MDTALLVFVSSCCVIKVFECVVASGDTVGKSDDVDASLTLVVCVIFGTFFFVFIVSGIIALCCCRRKRYMGQILNYKSLASDTSTSNTLYANHNEANWMNSVSILLHPESTDFDSANRGGLKKPSPSVVTVREMFHKNVEGHWGSATTG